jgi:RNA polymerase sigma-70 factor (ECF subfamily)
MVSERDYTDMGGSGYAFLTTRWSVIERIQAGEGQDDALIEALIQRYWKPVYYYLRRKGYGNEQAKDLTQGFFCEIILNRGLLRRADRNKGRFRAFLLHALNQYLLDQKDKANARKRSPRGGRIPLDDVDIPSLPQMICSLTPEDCYNYCWLCDLLEDVLAEVESNCRSDGLETHWTIFCEKIVKPLLGGTVSPSRRELCRRFGVEDEKKVSNMLITVKRRFQSTIHEHISATVTSDDEVDDEIRELLQYLPQTRPASIY